MSWQDRHEVEIVLGTIVIFFVIVLPVIFSLGHIWWDFWINFCCAIK